MRKKITYRLSIALLILSGIALKAQVLTLPGSPGEKVVLISDRSVYAINEEIQFSANYFMEMDLPDALSTVLYAELIRWNGDKISQVKIPIENGKASGSLTIPTDLLSGNYYLRAYTKWLRNFSVRDYAYLPIMIVNPYKKRTDQGPLPGDDAVCVLKRTASEDENHEWITGVNDGYGQRREVKISIKFPDDLKIKDYAISVVKSGSSSAEVCTADKKEVSSMPKDRTLEYYPEIHGLTLTGMLLDQEAGNTISNELLNLSTISTSEYFSAVKTDRDGRFTFALPQLEGVKEVSLSIKSDRANAKLLVDADFCLKSVRLPYKSFEIKEDTQDMVREVVRNMEISERIALTNDEEVIPAEIAFYGPASRIILEKEYIELEDLREFIYELVFEARVRELEDGTPGIYTTSYHTLSNSPMLVLMDNIPVSDLDELLNVSCRRIERMEIFNQGYVVGKNFYGGILSIFSEGKDMAGIKPDESSLFFDYQMFAKSAEVGSSVQPAPERLPQRNNTLLWSASNDIDTGETSSFSCFTGDETGEFEIVVIAVTESGERRIARREFVVN